MDNDSIYEKTFTGLDQTTEDISSNSKTLVGVDYFKLKGKLTELFTAFLIERDGECWRTEVRNSGIYICGVHSSLWEDEDEFESYCATHRETVEALESCYGEAVKSLRPKTRKVKIESTATGRTWNEIANKRKVSNWGETESISQRILREVMNGDSLYD